MLKRIVILSLIALVLFSLTTVFATEYDAVVEQHENAELVQIQESTKGKLEDYIAKYGSIPYGTAAFILNIVYHSVLLVLQLVLFSNM